MNARKERRRVIVAAVVAVACAAGAICLVLWYHENSLLRLRVQISALYANEIALGLDAPMVVCGSFPLTVGETVALGGTCDEPSQLASALHGEMPCDIVCDAFGRSFLLRGMRAALPDEHLDGFLRRDFREDCLERYGGEGAGFVRIVSAGSDGIVDPTSWTLDIGSRPRWISFMEPGADIIVDVTPRGIEYVQFPLDEGWPLIEITGPLLYEKRARSIDEPWNICDRGCRTSWDD